MGAKLRLNGSEPIDDPMVLAKNKEILKKLMDAFDAVYKGR